MRLEQTYHPRTFFRQGQGKGKAIIKPVGAKSNVYSSHKTPLSKNLLFIYHTVDLRGLWLLLYKNAFQFSVMKYIKAGIAVS